MRKVVSRLSRRAFIAAARKSAAAQPDRVGLELSGTSVIVVDMPIAFAAEDGLVHRLAQEFARDLA